MRMCHDCKKTKENVEYRQSEYFLCNECENVRQEWERNKDQPTSKPTSPLARILNRGMMQIQGTPTKTMNAPTNFKCRESCTGQIAGKTQECSLCGNAYHYSCVAVTRKQTLWFCHECKGMPKKVVEMTNTIAQLQTQVNEHIQTRKKQETLNSALAKMCDALQTRVIALEDTNKQLQASVAKTEARTAQPKADKPAQQQPNHHAATGPRNLLIGDSIIKEVQEKGLDSTKVECISGAKVNSIKETLADKDIAKFDAIIIHVGTNDCSESEATTDNAARIYEEMIDDINERAPNTIKAISSVLPRADDQNKELKEICVNRMNTKLRELAERKGCLYVDNDKNFRLKNDDADLSTLNGSKLHLSRNGTSRLLSNINDTHRILKAKPAEDRESDKRNGHARNPTSRPRPRPGNRRPQPAGHSRRNPRQGPRQYSHGHYHDYRHQNANSSCYNCGERNHVKKNCRFGKPLQCFNCGDFGHKASLCQNELGWD